MNDIEKLSEIVKKTLETLDVLKRQEQTPQMELLANRLREALENVSLLKEHLQKNTLLSLDLINKCKKFVFFCKYNNLDLAETVDQDFSSLLEKLSMLRVKAFNALVHQYFLQYLESNETIQNELNLIKNHLGVQRITYDVKDLASLTPLFNIVIRDNIGDKQMILFALNQLNKLDLSIHASELLAKLREQYSLPRFPVDDYTNQVRSLFTQFSISESATSIPSGSGIGRAKLKRSASDGVIPSSTLEGKGDTTKTKITL